MNRIPQVAQFPVRMKISRMKEITENDFERFYNEVIKEINNEYDNIMEGVLYKLSIFCAPNGTRSMAVYVLFL